MPTPQNSRYRPPAMIVLLITSLVTSSCQPFAVTEALIQFSQENPANRSDAEQQPTVRGLARNLDLLESYIETYGSVVAKQPDVWGQARLTKYRDEYEQQMAAELTNFGPTLQGQLSGSDQAYFADSAALGAAASSSAATIQRGASGGAHSSTTTNTTTLVPGSLTSPTVLTQAETTPAGSPPPPQIIGVPTPPAATGTFAAFNNISRTPVNMPQAIGFANPKGGLTLEPTLYLEEKSVYLNHLHELRRISEGDDTADSPGYSLNLVRFPVSVLPGKRTDVGYGADVTMTLRPYLNDELLPTTFRNLVANDLIDQIAFPVTQFINDPQNEIYLDERASADVTELLEFIDHNGVSSPLMAFIDDIARPPGPYQIRQVADEVAHLRRLRWSIFLEPLFKRVDWAWVDDLLQCADYSFEILNLKNDLAKNEQELKTAEDTLKDLLDDSQRAQRQFKALALTEGVANYVFDADPSNLRPIKALKSQVNAYENRVDRFLRDRKEQLDIQERTYPLMSDRRPQSADEELREIAQPSSTPSGASAKTDAEQLARKLELSQKLMATQQDRVIRLNEVARNGPKLKETLQAKITSFRWNYESARKRLHPVALVPTTKSRRARMPFPPSEITDVYGYSNFYDLAMGGYRAFSREPFVRPDPTNVHVRVHLPDVQGYLQEEIASARQLLELESNRDLWSFCQPALTTAIRNHQTESIKAYREQFFRIVQERAAARANAAEMQQQTQPQAANRTAVTLAWAIIVDAALLTEQLKQDIVEAAGLKGVPAVIPLQEDFYLPKPSAEARQAFNNYVQTRWPIHVFALDPAAWEQNIASTFSMRREMQLALSMAFVSGRMSASNMMQFARRLEFDFATIDLNGTAVGFSHGDDTFGWRFYPRFQTPDVDCNMTVFFRDQLWGGPNKNDLMKQRRLEPGIRECYAVVIMPSFVPYAKLNISTNWFSLTNPRKKELNTEDAVNLSNMAKSIENYVPCVVDGHCYLDDELERVVEKAKQLETRLPLRSTKVQVPYENTLGGFAMFSTGVTDLAPELIGWYGTSSINPNAATTVFLVGNHLSTHQTTVIAGGQKITEQQLLSRQVMQVTIPQNPLLVGDAAEKFVDVQLATPYGITQHLMIPAVVPPKPDPTTLPSTPPVGTPVQSIAWKPATMHIAYTYGGTGIVAPSGGTTPPLPPNSKPASLLIQQGDVDGTKYDQVIVSLKFDPTYGINPPNNSIDLPAATYDSTQNGYPISTVQAGAQIIGAFAGAFGPEDVDPPRPLSTTTKLTFHSSIGAYPDITTKTTSNSLTIKWIKAPSAGGGGAGAQQKTGS